MTATASSPAYPGAISWQSLRGSKPEPLASVGICRSDRHRILSLNRPEARNAISRQLLHELRTHIESISSEYASNGSEVPPHSSYGGAAGPNMRGPTRALIIASSVDSCFCAGADLKERAGFTLEEYV